LFLWVFSSTDVVVDPVFFFVYAHSHGKLSAVLTDSLTKLSVDETHASFSKYVVDGLQPDTLYKFYAVSLTAAGPSYENSSVVEARTGSAGLTAGHYAGIISLVVVALVFVTIGAVACIRLVVTRECEYLLQSGGVILKFSPDNFYNLFFGKH